MKRVRSSCCALFIIISLLALAFSNSISSASTTSSVTISFAGTVHVSATNFAHIPADWDIGAIWNAPTYFDNNVLHNGHPSIRMEKGDGTKSREILAANKSDSGWKIFIKPGDHLVFKVWMKTSSSTIGDTTTTSGIRLGIDFANNGGRITGIQSPDGAYWTTSNGYPSNQYLNYVNWGHDWELRTMYFIVQNQYPADGVLGYPAGQLETPNHIAPWVQVWSDNYGNTDNGLAWFADAELYINP